MVAPARRRKPGDGTATPPPVSGGPGGDGGPGGGDSNPVGELLSRTAASAQCTLKYPLGPKTSYDACMVSYGY